MRSRRAFQAVLIGALSCLTTDAHAGSFYNFIQKPWSLSSIFEVVAIAVFAGVIARSRHRGLAGLTLLCSFGWGVVRIWLDPIFDPLIGVILRNSEMNMALRVSYQVALLAVAVTPLAVALFTSSNAGHFVEGRWRRAVAPIYAVISAILIVSPEFMVLTVF